MIDIERILLKLDVNINKDQILVEALNPNNYITYHDPKTNTEVTGWDIKHIIDGYAYEVAQTFNSVLGLQKSKPRFYILRAGVTLGLHIDRGTECSFNFVLTGSSKITFEDREEYYEQALLNTQVMHGIINPQDDRVLYKISVFNQNFETVKQLYEENKVELKQRLSDIHV